ncbi:hypothetical protein [Marinicellulosiphila megalodicopiae]|uniref:hypothetical protein n=1 Tax=Marinicellulosiphila megalodicopiae TaxID=2724896 RepID=UPI003BAED137
MLTETVTLDQQIQSITLIINKKRNQLFRTPYAGDIITEMDWKSYIPDIEISESIGEMKQSIKSLERQLAQLINKIN